MGLQDLPPSKLHLLNSLVLARPIEPAEAYCHIVGISMVSLAQHVHKINVQPPNQRAYVSKYATMSVHPTQIYMDRPLVQNNLTFTEFYLMHDVRPITSGAPRDGTFVNQIGNRAVYAVPNRLVRFTHAQIGRAHV